MKHWQLLLILSGLLSGKTSFAFDLTPRSETDKAIVSRWQKSRIVKSVAPGVKTEAQLFVRQAIINGNKIDLASMTVFELQRKDLKFGSPDTINIGMGHLFGFNSWIKRQIDKDTYKFIGYSKEQGRIMQILWREEPNRFLYSFAMVEEEVLNPVSFEVEFFQRQLLDRKKSAVYDFMNVLIPRAQAETATEAVYKSEHSWGNEKEVKTLLNLITDEKKFEGFYNNVKGVSGSLGKMQSNQFPANSVGYNSISENGFKQLFTFNASDLAQQMGVTAAGASIAPLAAATSIAISKLDDLYKIVKEAITHEQENLQLLKDAEESHKNYIPAASIHAQAVDFRRGLINFKLALDALGVDQLEETTLRERLRVYENLLKDVDEGMKRDVDKKSGLEKCRPDNLRTLVDILRRLVPHEERGAVQKLDICTSIDTLGTVIDSYLQIKQRARTKYLTAINPLLDRMDDDEEKRHDDAETATKKASENFKRASERARKKFEKVKNTYKQRRDQRILKCLDSEQRINGTKLRDAEEICDRYDREKDLIGRKELEDLKDAEENFKKSQKYFASTASKLKKKGALENPYQELAAYKDLSVLTAKMTDEICLEPGGLCDFDEGDDDEGHLMALKYLNEQNMTKEKLQRACKKKTPIE